jgi:hypothetical protein
MLNVLDANWGNWNYNPQRGKVTFQDGSALNQYNGYFEDMTAAAQEQARLQTRLVNLPATASAR